ncbi:MAG TPA: penicillin-binding transpeptidase domain-containing protein, partial [Candidatus Baltobacteraceae bacterium]|nr:penicillin-binding transpeptidase domain-containing protein [Candidatus Baltobacteraceae bacterium]
QIDLAQAAMLAALPNDPVRLDPYRHRAALEQRRRLVLARMLAARAITELQARQAARERVAFLPRRYGILAAPHLLFALAAQAAPERARVRTTLDRSLQLFVETQVREVVAGLSGNDAHDAAALVVDNASGEVLAYAGSPDFFDEAGLGHNDGVHALRQPGSALKPFLYEQALEERLIRPTTILPDVPTAYALPEARIYRPNDYSTRFAGPVRVRLALADSLNVPAVKVLERLGVDRFLERLHELGFRHLTKPAAYYGLGLTLGAGEVSLYELAGAYVRLARGGSPVELSTVLGAAPAQPPRAAAPSWALVSDILSDAHARAGAFGVDSILALPFPAAVKTGTSSDFRDTWTAGFTRDYTVAVWVGNFDGRPMRGISGVTGAGPLWARIMLHLHETREPRGFDPPRGYVRRPICAESGARPAAGCRAVVWEWLDRGDLARYAKLGPAPLGDEYDAWLVGQPERVAAGTRVLFPREGDTFVYGGASSAGTLKFEFSGRSDRDFDVFVNGRRLSPRGADYLWQVRPGAFVLAVRGPDGAASVRFSVVPPARFARRGFTLAATRGPSARTR